jgi:predicted O-methyltransferase YrrM
MIENILTVGAESKNERQSNVLIVRAVFEQLANRGILSHDQVEASLKTKNFDAFANRVSTAFTIDESAITTRLARFLYNFSYVINPRNVLVVGSFQGNSLVWIAGGCSKDALCVGVDIDTRANQKARDNFLSLGVTNVRIYDMDGHQASSLFSNDIDVILLDADSPEQGKKIYMSLTTALLPKLKPGGFLLAHDMIWPNFKNDLNDFRCLISDRSQFAASIIVPIDRYGISICRKAK